MDRRPWRYHSFGVDGKQNKIPRFDLDWNPIQRCQPTVTNYSLSSYLIQRLQRTGDFSLCNRGKLYHKLYTAFVLLYTA